MRTEKPATLRTLQVLCVFLLVALPLVLLSCGSEDPTRRPVRDRSSSERTSAGTDGRSSIGEDPFQRPSEETDRTALEALFEATNGTGWYNSANWMTDEPLDEWYGVGTDESGRVDELHLIDNGLEGEIPAELGSLNRLRWLALTENRLSGEIPPQLGDLERLLGLDLSFNELEGEIPGSLGNLDELIVLQLDENRLSGEIPWKLGDLSSLAELSLASNRLTGEIPDELGFLIGLELLDLYGNPGLTGCVPEPLSFQLDDDS